MLKSGLDACDFDVILDAVHENHDHDMQWLYGEHTHSHEHSAHAGHAHTHRGYQDVLAIIEKAGYDGQCPGAGGTAFYNPR